MTTSSPCKKCEDRAAQWLSDYMEAWNGPKRMWTKKQKDEWFKYLAVLTLFAKDFQSPKTAP